MSKINPKAIKPLWNNLLVRQEKPPEKSSGGIYMPDDTRDKEKFQEIVAEVVKIGDMAFETLNEQENAYVKRKGYPQIGDKVIFRRYGGKVFDEELGEEGFIYRLIDETDITAILED